MKGLAYMHTRHPLSRSLAALLVVALLAPAATAQPAPGTTTGTTTGEDEALYACKKRSGQVAVTFKPETELKDLITWVMGFTCKNFILDPRIVSTGKKVTVIAPNKMSAQEAYNVFLVALSTMGLTVVPKGNMMRIVESATAKSETVPIYKKGTPANQDQIVRYVMRPTYAQVETLRGALDSIRSPAGSVQVAGSMLVITDYASQVRDMMSLAKAIDVPGGSDGIYTIAVKYADATNLAQKLNEILGISAGGGAAGRAGGGGVVLLAPGRRLAHQGLLVLLVLGLLRRVRESDLVRASDAVYSNLRGDQPARLGLTYADLASVFPDPDGREPSRTIV